MLVVSKYENTYSEGREWLLTGAFSGIREALLCDSGTCIKYLGLFGRREYYISSLLKRKIKIRNQKVNQNPVLLRKISLSVSCGGVLKDLGDTAKALGAERSDAHQ